MTERALAGILLCTCAISVGEARAKAPPAAWTAPAGGYTSEQTVSTALELAVKVGMTTDKQQLVFNRLEKRLRELVESHGNQPILGVMAYQMGEGGLIVKIKKGQGFVRWHQHAEDHSIEFKSISAGANIGGSSEWGVGLVLGIKDPTFFGGEYTGSTRGATALDASANTTDLTRSGVTDPNMLHTVVLLGAATGLSANAGSAKFKITVLY